MKTKDKFVLSVTLLFLSFLYFCAAPCLARTSGDSVRTNTGTVSTPAYCNTLHNVGKIALGVSNDGSFGTSLASGGSSSDCFTGAELPTCEYPKGSRTTYLFGGALWIGGVLGQDTLVSTAADGWHAGAGSEFHPEAPGLGEMIWRSTIDPARPEFDGAISEQDYIAVYYDTCLGCGGVDRDFLDNRSHRPLNLEVTQRTFAWSYSYAEDFVLFDYAIKNIGRNRLRRIYMGIYVDADIADLSSAGGPGAQDDLCGFRRYQPAAYLPSYCPPDSDQVNVAWTADNDGELGQQALPQVPNITATRIVRTPSDSLEVSFNWWISNGNGLLDFGPQARRTKRDFGTGGTGTPEGDRNKFYVLRNGDFDYDQARIASIGPLDSVWLPPPADRVAEWADGLDTRYVLSFGPFDIEPGQTLPISLAYLGGEGFHTVPSNGSNLPGNADAWYENVDFSDLGLNATWADWIYDNPGVDSDSDGYAGTMTICNRGGDSMLAYDTLFDPDDGSVVSIDTFYSYDNPDTIWRKGDGVPDFRGAGPPPAPRIKVIPSVGQVKVVWDGSKSETARDVFSRELDFEGYRVYFSRDERRASYVMMASFDKEDYNKLVWDRVVNDYVLLESPFGLEELRNLYGAGDSLWNPADYNRSNPLILPGFPDSIFIFSPQDFNRSILAGQAGANTPIRKSYPTAPPPPTLDADSIRGLFPNGGDSLYLTEDDFFKYYTYEYVVEDLLPTVPYWFNITSFDYGSPSSGLAALETNPTVKPSVTYPLLSNEAITEQDAKVFVYPNPYRLDANYRERGFEGRTRQDYPPERTRAIHFANVPPRCTISIYSLDGDLIREIEHDEDPADPQSNHAIWDMITRNFQAVVSGLYYWTVESDQGDVQIGKLVIIM